MNHRLRCSFVDKNIFILDDEDDNSMLIKIMLERQGMKKVKSFDNYEVMQKEMDDGNAPDVILMDIMMPVLDGISICRKIREQHRFDSTAIIFVTAKSGDEALLEGFEAGGQDFLRKPVSPIELNCRLKNVFMFQDLYTDLQQRNADLTIAAITDGLTRLHNRAYMEKRLAEEFEKCMRYEHRLSLLIMDIDHFKKVNDMHGHLVGDEVLKNLAELLKHLTRNSDLVARYGGEEITIILSGTSSGNAYDMAERIRLQISETALCHEPDLKVNVSIGVAEYEPEVKNWVELIDRADRALYKAKNTGRNKVCVWTEGM